MFYALTAVGIDEDDLKIRFKIAKFLRWAKDMQLERIADCHASSLQHLRTRASDIVRPGVWDTCSDIHLYASMTGVAIRVRELSRRIGRYNPIDEYGDAVEDSHVSLVTISQVGNKDFLAN